MSWNYPTTQDTPVKLAIMPDWSGGIEQQATYRTDITRSRRGLEQRTSRQRRPILSQSYQWTSSEAAARRRIEDAITQARGPLIVPWWPHGIPLRVAMVGDTIADLEYGFIEHEEPQIQWVYFWHRTAGAEWREVSAVAGSILTLVDTGTHIDFPAGSFCFPAFLAMREAADSSNRIDNARTVDETLNFRTL